MGAGAGVGAGEIKLVAGEKWTGSATLPRVQCFKVHIYLYRLLYCKVMFDTRTRFSCYAYQKDAAGAALRRLRPTKKLVTGSTLIVAAPGAAPSHCPG